MSWAKGRPGPALPLVLLLALLLPHPLYAAPPLLSLLVPWADAEAPPTGALENLGEAPYLASPAEDDSRLHALLGGGRVRPAGAEEWEAPTSPDLFLLTEVGAEGARPRGQGRRPLDDPQDAMGGRRKRDGFISGAGGSRVRTGGVGGGIAGSAGMRVGAYGGGGGRALGGGGRGLGEGPSLSIVNPLDVLRQRLLLEIARRRMRESEDQIQANRELLKSIGKREAAAADGPKAPSSM